jgi:hypothetical protein
MRMTTRVVAAVIAVSLLGLGSAWGDGQIPTVRDVARIVKVSDPQFSPDGKTLAYLETGPIWTRMNTNRKSLRHQPVRMEPGWGEHRVCHGGSEGGVEG